MSDICPRHVTLLFIGLIIGLNSFGEVNNMIKFRRLRCSFCRKNNDEVLKLVAGPRVYICDECVAIANRLMDEAPHDDSPSSAVEPTIWHKLSARVQQLFHGRQARMTCPF